MRDGAEGAATRTGKSGSVAELQMQPLKRAFPNWKEKNKKRKKKPLKLPFSPRLAQE